MPLPPDLLQTILELPLAEREDLLRLLTMRLGDAPPNPVAEQAWDDEALRRLDAYERGEAEAGDWLATIKQVRGSLENMRAS